jgi:hypothetical protein
MMNRCMAISKTLMDIGSNGMPTAMKIPVAGRMIAGIASSAIRQYFAPEFPDDWFEVFLLGESCNFKAENGLLCEYMLANVSS